MWIVVAVLVSGVSAVLIARGRWVIVLAMVVALPAVIVIQRFPMTVLAVWLVVTPFLLGGVEDGGQLKLLYWVVNRALPLAALVAIVISYVTRTGYRRLGSLGWPEVFMLAYVAVSVLSILFASAEMSEGFRHLYDRAVIPMILYLLVRLTRPGPAAMKKLAYILLFIILSQATVGLLAWVAPGVLPERFLGRVGQRTLGTLDHANVFGIVALAAGALFLHISRYESRLRKLGVPVFVFSVAMAILTLSRASWLAALLVVIGVAIVYPRVVANVALAGVSIVFLFALLGGGRVIGQQLEQRFYSAQSEESALSRLPVVLASIRMIEAKPLTGWGYDNFDLYDYQFQSRVGELFVPDKDHASHNLHLTIGAEQGLIGLFTFLGAAIYWLFRTPAALARLEQGGMFGRRLLVILWVIIAGHVVVSQFFNMKSAVGFAVWWLSLALIGNIITGASPTTPRRSVTSAVAPTESSVSRGDMG